MEIEIYYTPYDTLEGTLSPAFRNDLGDSIQLNRSFIQHFGAKTSRFADGTLRTAFPTNQLKQCDKLKFEPK